MRKYLLVDLVNEAGEVPVAIAVYRVINSHEFANTAGISKWLHEFKMPHETFQIFPLNYVAFYDMSDVLMFKLIWCGGT